MTSMLRITGTILAGALCLSPVAAQQPAPQQPPSVKDLLNRAEAQSGKRLVEDLIEKLGGGTQSPQGAPAPAGSPAQLAPAPAAPQAAAPGTTTVPQPGPAAAPAPPPAAPQQVAVPAPQPAPNPTLSPGAGPPAGSGGSPLPDVRSLVGPAPGVNPAAPAATQVAAPPAQPNLAPVQVPAPPTGQPTLAPPTAAPAEPPVAAAPTGVPRGRAFRAPNRTAAPGAKPFASDADMAKAPEMAEKLNLPSADIEVYFDFDSAEVTPQAVELLDGLGAAMTDPRLAGQKFVIAGHTDAQGRADYNLALSQRRAEAVRQYVIDKHGIDPANLIARGFGKSRLKNPRAPLADENRRVQIINWTSQAVTGLPAR